MQEETVSMLMALAGATLALAGVYMLITTVITGATQTIDMMGYAIGALLIFEGLTHFAPNYARIE